MAESVEAKVTTKISPVSVTETVTRLTGLLSQKGLKGLRGDRPEC
jgi:hypothetical protein